MSPMAAFAQDMTGVEGQEEFDGEPQEGSAEPSDENEEQAGESSQADAFLPIPIPEGVDERTAREYEEYWQASKRYLDEVEEYKAELSSVVMTEYNEKLATIDSVYQAQITEKRKEERSFRDEAITRLESFLEKHPATEAYTPGVLYRLAVLHYEKADDEYYSKDASQVTRDYPDFSTSVAYTRRLIGEYPEFPQLDGAYYLLGFCLLQMEDDEGALLAFVNLTENYPESPKAAEAYTRIGEYYFSQSQAAVQGIGEEVRWEESKKYYKMAVDLGPEYSIYDRALYRLAWTEYYIENYDSMIHRFMELVEYADKVPQGSTLRQEAIEFMAAALAEEDWNLQDDISRDPDFGMVRFNRYLNQGRAFEIEVLRVYADTLAEQTRFDYAAQAYQALLERAPCDPENPKIHQALIAALNFSEQSDEAVKIQSQLDSIYGKGSQWYLCQEQEGNLEAIAYAENTARKALKYSISTYLAEANSQEVEFEDLQAAYYQARSEREKASILSALQEKEKTTRDSFALTAQTTQELLERYPNDEDVYVYRYILADSLFRSEQYDGAAQAFAQVRDFSDGRYRRDAANGVIDANKVQLLKAVESGERGARGLPPATIKEMYAAGVIGTGSVPSYILREIENESGETEEISQELATREEQGIRQQEEIPPRVMAVMDARQKYIDYGLDSRRPEGEEPLVDDYRYLNALTNYHYGHKEEARAGFNEILEKHPETEFAVVSAGFIIATYEEEGDLDKVAEVSDRLRELDLGGGSDEELDLRLRDIKYGALFQKARKLFEAEEYAAAAKEYERIADENPEFENIHLALYNAGVAYERIKRYESAMRLYRRVYNEYNETEEAADALYRVGFNGERFFDFDSAVESYLELHDSRRESFQNHPERTNALKKAAIIEKYTADFENAAILFERYHDEHESQEDAPLLLFESAVMYEELGDYREMARVLEKFRKEYGRDPGMRVTVLKSYNKQADYFFERKDYRKAESFFEKALDLYRENPSVGGADATYFAAKSQFMLAEIEYLGWAEIKLEGSLKKLEAKKEGSGVVAQKFKQVLAYKNAEWTLAANYRIGAMFHNFAKSMETASCPPSLDEYTCEGFLDSLLEASFELKDLARKNYEAVVRFGKENDVNNQWVRSSLNGLNDIAPKEYPLFEGERLALKKSIGSPRPMVSATSDEENQDRDELKAIEEEK